MLKFIFLFATLSGVKGQLACTENPNCQPYTVQFTIRVGSTTTCATNKTQGTEVVTQKIVPDNDTDLVWYAQCGGKFVSQGPQRIFGSLYKNTQPEKMECSATEDVFIWIVCPGASPNCTIRLDHDMNFLIIKTPWSEGRVNMTSAKTYLMYSFYNGNPIPFDKKWGDYVNGFCTIGQACWLGLENLSVLSRKLLKFYFEVPNYVTTWGKTYVQAYYYDFYLSGSKYQIKFKTRFMKNDPGTGGLVDSFSLVNNTYFSTQDNDNDQSTENCASGKTPWWYGTCQYDNAFLNGNFAKVTSMSNGYIFMNFKLE